MIGSNQDLLKEIEKRGGHYSAHTDSDYTCFNILLPASEIVFGISALAEILFETTFTEQELAQTKSNILAEITAETNNPEYQLKKFIYNKIYKEHPYNRSPLGDSQKIRNYSLPDLKSFQENFYVPNNITIVLAGDFNRNEAHKALSKLEKIPGRPVPANIIRSTISTAGTFYQSHLSNLANPRYFIVYSVPGISSPDAYILAALTSLLGNSPGSLLNQKLYNSELLLKNITCTYAPAKDRSLFIVEFPLVGIEHLSKLRQDYQQLINQIMITPEAIQETSTRIKSDYYLNRSSVENAAWHYGYNNTIDGYEYERDFLLHINNLNAQQVQAVLNKYFTQGEQFLFY
jgi:predicted Zn-dependent peptidase